VDNNMTRQGYIGQLLDAYRRTPTASGPVRRQDRLLAAALYDRGVPLTAVENALVLAASRRIFRPPDAPPLLPIRSLHYLMPVIREVIELRVSPDYFRYLQFKIDQFLKSPQAH
jgi:hypothetical protein